MNEEADKSVSFETNHATYLDYQVKLLAIGGGDVLLTLGNGGCYSWNVLTREDAIKLASAILEVTK
jgi:hypothetical protein